MATGTRRVLWWGGAWKALLLPPTGLIWPALIGFGWMLAGSPNLGFGLLMLSFVALVVMSMPGTHRWLGRRLDLYAPLDPGAQRPMEKSAIVVLDAGRRLDAREYGGDSIKPRTLERLRYSAWLYHHWHLPVLVSGNGAGKLMAEVLDSSFGVPEVWMEVESRNTHESAIHSSEVLRRRGIEHMYLVTHFWHMPRAIGAFRDTELTVTPAPMGLFAADGRETGWGSLIPRISALEGSHCAVHELIGLSWYLLWYRHRP